MTCSFLHLILWLRCGQLLLILDFIHFFEQNAVPRFKLPNQKIDANSEQSARQFLPVCEDLQQLFTLINRAGLPNKTTRQLEVRDLFLWELLPPLCGGQRREYSGCPAANSFGHVDHCDNLLRCVFWSFY